MFSVLEEMEESYGVERTKVASDTANLILENLVIEPRLEFTLSLRCCSDISSFLSTSEDDKVLLRGERGGV